ncbi:MAG: potassium channel family protein [Spirochaetes bacterium]|nr:potassium channel family protein [Spirochaetota bacterium]
MKKRIYEIIERAKPHDTQSKIFDITIIILIILNVVAVIINSFSSLPVTIVLLLKYIELFSVIVFSIEYLLRLWTADMRYINLNIPRIRYVFSFMALIDLFAILPFYLPFIIPFDLRFIRMLRLLRLLRIFKLNRYNDAMDKIGRVLRKEKEKLLTTIFVTSILLIFASSIMYYVENEAQPEQFPNIIASIWWAIATLTTVGYGDVYPITALGKILSGIIAILGIGLVALPTGIISSGFITEVTDTKNKRIKYCPHCGKELD